MPYIYKMRFIPGIHITWMWQRKEQQMTNTKNYPPMVVLELERTFPWLLDIAADLEGQCTVDELLNHLFEFLRDEINITDATKMLRLGYRFPEHGENEEEQKKKDEEQIKTFVNVLREIKDALVRAQVITAFETTPYRFHRAFGNGSIVLVRADLAPLKGKLMETPPRPVERVWETTFGRDMEYRIA